jgi:CheY-like chemotaxis protein
MLPVPALELRHPVSVLILVVADDTAFHARLAHAKSKNTVIPPPGSVGTGNSLVLPMAKILLADDSVELTRLLHRALTAAGHEVTVVHDGKDAIEQMSRDVYDLLITDIVMPDLGGLDVLRRLRKSAPGTRIIAMSGGGRGSSEQYLELAASFGAVATLAKPFPLDALTAAVTKALAP